MTGKLWKFKSDTTLSLTHVPIYSALTRETSTHIYYVSEDDQSQLWKLNLSTGSDELVEDRTKKIQAIWHDSVSGKFWIVDCNNDSIDAIFYVWTLTISTDTVTEIDDFTESQGHIWVEDIVKCNSDYYVILTWYFNVANTYAEVLQVTVDPIVSMDKELVHGRGSNATVIGAFIYWMHDYFVVATRGYLHKYDEAGGTISRVQATGNNYNLPGTTRTNLWSIVYDGTDLIYYIYENVADDTFLFSYTLEGSTYTQYNEWDICFQQNRHTSGSAPNEFPKGFPYTHDAGYSIVYELKGYGKSPLLQSQTIYYAGQSIRAITDNYIIFDDGQIYKHTDLIAETPRYVATANYSDGIFPFFSEAKLRIHPVYANDTLGVNYFKEGDMIKLYDTSDNLCFKGFLLTPTRGADGVYYLTAEAYKNELLIRKYSKVYTADETSTKMEDALDNNCQYNYYSASIDATALTYSYILNERVGWLFELGRYLERGIVYSEPDGKTHLDLHDSLDASGLTWDHTDGDLVPLPGERISAYINGKTGITYAEVAGGVNDAGEVYYRHPTSISTEGQSQYPKSLKVFDDPAIMNYDEAKQLAENLYAIFNPVTQFVCLGDVKGKNYLQVGQTLTYANTKYGISSRTFLFTEYRYDVINDRYRYIVLTDSIILYNTWKGHNWKVGDKTLRQIAYLGTTPSTAAGVVSSQYTLGEVRANKAASDGSEIFSPSGAGNCLYVTGTYTGNAANNREITGLGFDATQIMLWRDEGAQIYCYHKIGTPMGEWESTNCETAAVNDNTIRFITDGFEVNNNHAGDHHNVNAKNYRYVAWGY